MAGTGLNMRPDDWSNGPIVETNLVLRDAACWPLLRMRAEFDARIIPLTATALPTSAHNRHQPHPEEMRSIVSKGGVDADCAAALHIHGVIAGLGMFVLNGNASSHPPALAALHQRGEHRQRRWTNRRRGYAHPSSDRSAPA